MFVAALGAVAAYRALGEWLALACIALLVGLFAVGHAWRRKHARAGTITEQDPTTKFPDVGL